MDNSGNGPYINKRSNERLRYAVDVAQKSVNDAFKIFSIGKRPYHQLFSDVCQDINAQLDTLNLLIKPLIEAAPLYDFEDVEANGIRSVLGVVDSVLRELIAHLRYCTEKHASFFFNGTNSAAKLARFCLLLSRLGKMLDITTAMHQQLGGKGSFVEVNNPVGAMCMQEYENLPRDCFFGQLVGIHYLPQIRNVMKGVCVVMCSYGIGYYSEAPSSFGQPQSLLWKGSASVISGAKFLMNEEERARKFVELTHNCATIDFTKSFWSLLDVGPLADVPKMVNKRVDVACQIFIEGEPLYVKNKHDQMILMHPPVGRQGFAGVTVGFLSSKCREGQVACHNPDQGTAPVKRFPKSKRLLIHFHGGGFVAGSHVQHEMYLRTWCNDLDAVVVSINYSLAPENPFPKGLDDCVFAYAWCLENLHTLGCTGKSIVFAGDSAGGNLAISTAMRALSYGLRAPDGVLAAYPVTYVKYAGSVSRLLSALDIMLPSGVLQCCLRAYSGVPVDSNAGFYRWLQTAHSKPAEGEEGEGEEGTNVQSISADNSRFISDVCGDLSDTEVSDPLENATRDLSRESPSRDDAARDSQSYDVTGLEVAEDHSNCEIKEEVDLDTIQINPIVFDKTSNHGAPEEEVSEQLDEIVDDDQGSMEMEDEGGLCSTGEVGDHGDSTSVNREASVPICEGDGTSKETGQCEELDQDGGDKNEESDTALTKIKLESAMSRNSNDDDLEKMLYEESETRFKGAKLVLTPDRSTAESRAAPQQPAQPSAVTPTRVLKKATVVRDDADDQYDMEPAYVINPGEIATRNNSTLLEKYFDDPFMSPYLADESTLAELPPIHIVGAEFDPLLDDAVAFCRRMKGAGGRVSLEVVPGMTHGFLNLVLSSSTCAAAAKRCQDALARLFDSC